MATGNGAVDNRVLEIVFFLMDRMQQERGPSLTFADLSTDLRGLGYSDDEISSAYGWFIDHMQATTEQLYASFPEQTGSTRVLTRVERSMFDPEALALLTRLAVTGLLNLCELESVLDRVASLSRHPVTLEQLRMIGSIAGLADYSSDRPDASLDDDPDALAGIN